MTNLRVGMVVEIIKVYEPHLNFLIGQQCTLVKYYKAYGEYGFETDLHDGEGRVYWGPPECFKPFYDGNKKISWEDMKDIWTPHKEQIQQ